MSAASHPLTAPQYGMWAGQRMDPDSPAFWTAEAIELRGPLDAGALGKSVFDTLRRCDALHMRYRERDGEVRQRLDASRTVSWARHDFSGADDPWGAAAAWMRADLDRPARLDTGPLFATALLRLGPERHLWYLRAHHIALDGFAYLLLIHRVAELYGAHRTGRAPPPGRDFGLAPVIEEAEAYRWSAQCTQDRRFWQARLQDARVPVTLAPLRPPSDTARSERHRLPAAAYTHWQAGARACGVDWGAWLLAGIGAWMQGQCGTREVTVGLLVMNRLGSRALTVPCMGMNVVPLRLDIDPQAGFDALARQARDTLATLRPHQRYNYEWMREDAGLAGSHRQLYGPVLNLMPFDRGFRFDGLHAEAHSVSVGSVEDMDITVSPLPDGLRVDMEANPAAYGAKALRDHHRQLLATLDAALADPGQPVGRLAEGRSRAA
ncbi:condensation protein [Lysobacter sp. SG-8]|uniref:Condensation protein n=1 Tax=Marilutibacter penaei TaxID=2759900 RepID=A0A7W3U3C9_9GAMM|nr:condensation domain-containing protein [Lysobacter penaei]MBB1087865.1 condensation protein [Lysobacter penaei]